MVMLILVVFAMLGVHAQAADFTLTAAQGVAYTRDQLADVRMSAQVGVLSSGVSVGIFGNHKYVSSGIGLKLCDRLEVGLDAAYLSSVPGKYLTGRWQFKPSITLNITDSLSVKYLHFSNGSGKTNSSGNVNNGRDFLGLTWRT